MLFNNFNLCISAAMDELNIMPIEALGRYMQIKNSINNKSETIFSGLLENCDISNSNNSIKNTRVVEMKRYINKNNIYVTNRKDLKQKVWDMRKNKKQIYPPTKANNFRAIHHIRDVNRIMKLEFIKNSKMAANLLHCVELVLC